ncbi:MAG: hypothetical protein B7Y35_06155 [Sphingomonadales bacterium 28-64-96]|nr:MAG: hypothetical protein B7Y35_06155 [Sphingomonadales bacterium 28-64-96]
MSAAAAIDSADEITERLARELAAQAMGEVQFMQQLNIPAQLGRHLALAALRRAAIKLEAKP